VENTQRQGIGVIQFKSDGRFKYYDKGLHYIVQFQWSSHADRQLFAKLIKYFDEQYGPHKEKLKYTDTGAYFPNWRYNQNWRCEQNANAKRRRIYLKDESMLSMALLKVG
jgi:hypothetical protein